MPLADFSSIPCNWILVPNSFFKLLTAVFVDKDCLDKYAIINISKAPTKTITHIILSKRPLYILVVFTFGIGIGGILVVSSFGKDNDFILFFDLSKKSAITT